MSKLTQWLPGMYVPLEDFEDDYDLAVVEDWMRELPNTYFIADDGGETTLGVSERYVCVGYGYQDSSQAETIRITPTQALEIVRNSREVK